MPRQEFELTDEDFKILLNASKPVPYIAAGGPYGEPASPQENANRAWAALGTRLGFDSMTVEPSPRGNRFFTAVSTEI